ncbi:MAG TPA: acylneuraminate cytidylyltransferase family protein [Pyrinomonadaceae bacterium]|nr:acylneuraminate cytidylyltransferase family protein [Pyrinomonadaceae bacterium]
MADVLALIPARAGSKSIPRKNLATLAGKPLIVWTIEAARSSHSLTRIVVSTDDPEIADVAEESGASVPFVRPAALAQDETPAIQSILHAVNWLDEHEGYRPDFVMVLQPTSPLRQAEDIDAVIKLAQDRKADAVVSVTPAQRHPFWMKRVTEDGRLQNFFDEDKQYVRRQDLPPAFELNGAIYLAQRDVLIEGETFYTDRTFAYVMPHERAVDVDEPWDLYLAELILRNRK